MSQNSPPPPESPQQPPPQPGGSPGAGPKKASPLLPGGWIALIVLSVLAIVYFASGQPREIRYDQFDDLVNSGQVKSLVLVGSDRADGISEPHPGMRAALHGPRSAVLTWSQQDFGVRQATTPTRSAGSAGRDATHRSHPSTAADL